MNGDNLNKILPSYDRKLELKPKQREALIYLGLRKGDFELRSCDAKYHVITDYILGQLQR